MRQKIVLYNPKTVFFTMPLGLLAIGSALDPARYEVKIIDGRLVADPVAAVLEEIEDALCVGVTVLTGAPIEDALRVLRAVKAARPELPTICGGWHPSLFPTAMLEEPSIDVTVQAQGEVTFRELVSAVQSGVSLEGLTGTAYRDSDGPRLNPPRPMQDMESLPAPDYSLIPVEEYFRMKGVRQLDYITSVGCHFRCAFCADPFVYGRKWNAIGPERLGAELDMLQKRYAFTDVNFQDDTFFTYRKRVAGIAEEFLRRGLDCTWAATMRADQGVRLTEEIFSLCVRSGLRRVLIGVESGSPRMLERIAKDTTVEQILQSADLCARHGVAVMFSFIVGFPGETDEDVMETVALAKKLRRMNANFDTPVFYYKPYPGSALANGVEADIPVDLDGWARFDFVQGMAGPWVSSATYRFIERFKFYNRHVWSGKGVLRQPLGWLARRRCEHDWYGLPLEKVLVERFRPEQRLS